MFRRHRLDPPKVQSEIQIRKDTSQDMRDTRLARNSQSIRIRPPDQLGIKILKLKEFLKKL